MKIELLDCTLRDGGYINDWNFSHDTLVSIYERVTSAKVDFIELGFLDDSRKFDINRSIMPTTKDMERIYGKLPRTNTKLMGMIDFGHCKIENIQPCSESILDGIRVIFKKHLREPAMEFCRQLKEKGYIVFSQLVSITSYKDDELMDLIRLVNEVRPYAVSMVDTYGLLYKDSLFHFYDMLNQYVDPSVAIGYHAHNNFQLGFSNCIELLNHHKEIESNHPLLVDGTVFGMGKSAGNAATELLAMYMNDNYGKDYDVNQILEAIDTSIRDLYAKQAWGYRMKFFISASNDCHPNYVTYLQDKKTLTVSAINTILKQIPFEKKLMYDKNLIEQLYIDFQANTCEDSDAYKQLAERLGTKDVLILGPGRNITDEADKVSKFIEEKEPVVIAINYIPEKWNADYLFLTNSKRYTQQASAISELRDKVKIIATSNVTRMSGKFDYYLDYEKLIDRDAEFPDNSFIMLLKVLNKVGAKSVSMAGLDGYSADKDTFYYSSKMEYDFAKQKGQEINADVNKTLTELKKMMNLQFVTSTVYKL